MPWILFPKPQRVGGVTGLPSHAWGGNGGRRISIEPGCTRFAVDAFSEAPKGRPKVAQGNALGFRPPIHFSPEGAHQSLNQQNQTGRPSTPSNPQRHTVAQATPWEPSTGTNRGLKVRPQCLTIRPGLQPSGISGGQSQGVALGYLGPPRWGFGRVDRVPRWVGGVTGLPIYAWGGMVGGGYP